MPRKSSSALQPSLRAVVEKEVAGATLPLPLARFATARGVDRATIAMRIATGELLGRISTGKLNRESPISVGALCKACNVSVKGAERVSSHRDREWDANVRSRSHVGEIVFDGESASIKIPSRLDFSAARITIAHELGHFLIHTAATNRVTARLPSTFEEEALAEYGGRLMLMPSGEFDTDPSANLAEVALCWSRIARTTLHSAVARLGDPDIGLTNVRGAIMWRSGDERAVNKGYVSGNMAPHWHLCSPAYIPIRRCKARPGSIIATAAAESSSVSGSAVEHVRIGTLNGLFRVDVVSWGFSAEGTRMVLSTFSDVEQDAVPSVTRYELRDAEQLAMI